MSTEHEITTLSGDDFNPILTNVDPLDNESTPADISTEGTDFDYDNYRDITVTDNHYINDLIGTLREHGKDVDSLLNLFNYIEVMERHVESAYSSMRIMDDLLQQYYEAGFNHPSQLYAQQSTLAAETDVSHLKEVIGEIKYKIVETCKSILESFKENGAIALNGVVGFLKLKPILQSIKDSSQNTINRCNRDIAKIESFSNEYHQVGLHLKNLARLVVGKEPVTIPKEMGKFAGSMCRSIRAYRTPFTKINVATNRAISKLKTLENSVVSAKDKKTSLMDKIAENKDKIRLLDTPTVDKNIKSAELPRDIQKNMEVSL